jgi:drug/metabolite transporter (DMT)-like permease
MVDSLTVVMMLVAGVMHASWHSLVKHGGDQTFVLAGMGLVAAAIASCALPFVAFPSAPVWGVIAISTALHVCYKLALSRSYSFGDLGQAYPLARGLVPLFSTAFGFVLLNQVPSQLQIAGVAMVSLGLMWLATHSIYRGTDRRLYLAALGAGFTVAGYSIIDAYGTRLADDWVAFTAWLIVVDSLCFSALIYALKGPQLWNALRNDRKRILFSGLLGVMSFSVFLWALSRSPAGSVSALRESSVIFAVLIGRFAHSERGSIHRLFAGCLIVAGLVTIALVR